MLGVAQDAVGQVEQARVPHDAGVGRLVQGAEDKDEALELRDGGEVGGFGGAVGRGEGGEEGLEGAAAGDEGAEDVEDGGVGADAGGGVSGVLK